MILKLQLVRLYFITHRVNRQLSNEYQTLSKHLIKFNEHLEVSYSKLLRTEIKS